MISSRIERTLKTSVDRRKIGRLPMLALAGAAILAAGASAQGLLVEPPAPAPPAPEKGKVPAVEIVQLQTMDAQPIYWKPSGAKIPASKAITTAHSMKANPNDVVVWTRVRDPHQNAHLWVVSAGSFSTNSGYGFYRDGWWYSSSRIYSGGKKLPPSATLRTQVSVGEYQWLGDYLTAAMIEKGEGRNSPVSVGGKYVVAKWGTAPFAWQKWDGRKPAGREAPVESFFVDVRINRSLDEGALGFHSELKDSKQKYQTSIESLLVPTDNEVKWRFWIKAKPEDIKRLYIQTRPNFHPEFKGVALRPKS